nr:hypothetical protein [Tanacetum cinerariifolium]
MCCDDDYHVTPRVSSLAGCDIEFNYKSEGYFVVNFIIQNKPCSFTLEEFNNILGIPSKGHCSYSDKWSLDYLEISSTTKGHYQTTSPSPSVNKTLIQTPHQGLVTSVRNKKTINVDDNEILNCEIQHHISSWVEIIRENVFYLGGHRDHAILPYGLILTRLFTHIVSNLLESSNDRYILCDHVMNPYTPHYKQKMRSDHGTKRCRSSNPSTSSYVLDHPSSSHHIDENNDGNDEESFNCNTSSPSQLVNSLSNIVPRVFENPPHENQTLHSYQSEILDHQSQHRDEHRKGLRSIKKSLKNVMRSKKK